MRRRTLAVLASLMLGGAGPAWAQGVPCDGALPVLARVGFSGNRTFRDGQLANLIRTTQSSVVRRLTRVVGARYCMDSVVVSSDSLRLVLFYYTQGFQQARIGREIAFDERNRAVVTFTVDEGAPVLVDSLSVNGLDDVPDGERIARGLPLRRGGRFARDLVEASRDSLTRRLRDSGYPLADVLRNVDFYTAERRAVVWYDVIEGPRMRVDSIAISVESARGHPIGIAPPQVREALGLRERSLFSQRELEAVKRGLYLTGAYQHVDVSVDSTSLGDAADSVVQVDVTLREAEMRESRASIGWGSEECLRTQAATATRNFLGGLRRLDVNARLARIGSGEPFRILNGLCRPGVQQDERAGRLDYYVGAIYTQPALFGRRFLPALTVYSERRFEFPTYVRRVPIGILGSVQRGVAGRFPSSFSYQLEYGATSADRAYFCAVFNVCDDSTYRVAVQQRQTGIVGWSVSRLPSDLINPSRGWGGQFEVRHASRYVGSGSLVRFTRASVDLQWYRRVLDGGIFVARVRSGTVLGSRFSFSRRADFVPPEERLYAGGANSVRGFGQNELGPVVYIAQGFDTVAGPGGDTYFRADPANPDHPLARPGSQPTGGDNVLVANAEMRLASPVYPELLQYALFVDAGEVWNRLTTGGLSGGFKGLKVTPGAGVRLFSPIGPIRVDIAFGPRDLQGGPAYYRARQLVDDQGNIQPTYCLSPFNKLVVDLGRKPAAQEAGGCPVSYTPQARRSLVERLRFHFSIGQAF